jgi:hypothetical protein
MKTLKTYEDFCNEEINWKKAAAGVALGAGLAFGNPTDAISQTKDSTLTQRVDSEIVEIDSIKSINREKDDIINGYYYTTDGKWQKTKGPSEEIYNLVSYVSSIESMFMEYKSNKYFVIVINSKEVIIINNNEYNKCIESLSKYNENIIINGLVGNVFSDGSLEESFISIIEHDESIKNINNLGNSLPRIIFKVGYVDGNKIVRFLIDTSDSRVLTGLSDSEIAEFDKSYYEISFNNFSEIFIK